MNSKEILSIKSFGGVDRVTGKILILMFSGKGENILVQFHWDSFFSESFIAVGAMQSYGPIAVALPGNSAIRPQRITGLSMDFDESTSTVDVDSNISIKALDHFLSEKGFSLFVMPGAENATVGGCIAADVHGKNGHKSGSFGDHICGLSLFEPLTGKVRWINKNESDFLWTIGGFGATGVILTARINVIRRPGNSMVLRVLRFTCAKKLIQELIANSEQSDDIGAWFSPRKKGILGKIFIANWTNDSPLIKSQIPPYFSYIVFVILGFSLWRKFASRILSTYIFLRNEPSFPQIPNNVLFPLSGLVGWNKFFGKAFIERQFLVPVDQGVYAIESVLNLLRQYGIETPLCAVKIFRGQRSGAMSFANEGISFSIQYEIRYKELDKDLSSLMIRNFYPEYLAKIQQTSTSFPSGYFNYKSWLDIAKSNRVDSVLIEWLRSIIVKRYH